MKCDFSSHILTVKETYLFEHYNEIWPKSNGKLKLTKSKNQFTKCVKDDAASHNSTSVLWTSTKVFLLGIHPISSDSAEKFTKSVVVPILMNIESTKN